MNELGLDGWQAWLSDLWAKEPVKIVVEGGLGETDACLYLRQKDGDWGAEASVVGALDFESAMEALWDDYEATPDA